MKIIIGSLIALLIAGLLALSALASPRDDASKVAARYVQDSVVDHNFKDACKLVAPHVFVSYNSCITLHKKSFTQKVPKGSKVSVVKSVGPLTQKKQKYVIVAIALKSVSATPGCVLVVNVQNNWRVAQVSDCPAGFLGTTPSSPSSPNAPAA